jgi:chromatin remodeling complex protein RSC6
LFPLLKQSHVSLIHAAADTALNPAARVGYSPAVVKYLSAILGRHFEHPMYYSEKETKEEKEGSTSTPKAKKKTSKRKPNPVLVGSVQPDDKLAVIVGSQPLTREELTIKLWDYIKKHGCQDKKKPAMINADDLLRPVFNGESQVSMVQMAKLVSMHLR